MPTSPLKGLLRTGRSWDENAAIDACFARDHVLNNLAHAADEFAQVRVNFTRTTESLATDPWRAFGAGGFLTDRWQVLGSIGPFPVPLRARGESYRYRVRIAGSSFGDSTTNVYRIVLAPPELAAEYLDAEEDFVFEATASSMTPAWLTGTSKGPLASPTQMSIPARYTSAWMRVTNTRTTVGGDPCSVAHPLVSATVFGKTTYDDPDGDWVLAVEGLYIAEWIGP